MSQCLICDCPTHNGVCRACSVTYGDAPASMASHSAEERFERGIARSAIFFLAAALICAMASYVLGSC